MTGIEYAGAHRGISSASPRKKKVTVQLLEIDTVMIE